MASLKHKLDAFLTSSLGIGLAVGLTGLAILIIGLVISWLPVAASTYSADIDWLYYYIYYISLFFTIVIVCVMVFFVLRHRQTDRAGYAHGATHNTPLELFWTFPPVVIVLTFFVFGFNGYLDMETPPGNPYQIVTTGSKWQWGFQYPGGGSSNQELLVPDGQPIELILRSTDVIHSVYIPAFRIKKDVVPGRYNRMWFQTEGLDLKGEKFAEFDLYCTEYCGQGHSQMLGTVKVYEPDYYVKVIVPEVLERFPKAEDYDMKLPDLGRKVADNLGCFQCHTYDTPQGGQGPSWVNLYGKTQTMVNGETITADAAYIRESILQPGAKIVPGWANAMTPYEGRIREGQTLAIIEFMKSISNQSPEPPEQCVERWALANDLITEQEAAEIEPGPESGCEPGLQESSPRVEEIRETTGLEAE